MPVYIICAEQFLIFPQYLYLFPAELIWMVLPYNDMDPLFKIVLLKCPQIIHNHSGYQSSDVHFYLFFSAVCSVIYMDMTHTHTHTTAVVVHFISAKFSTTQHTVKIENSQRYYTYCDRLKWNSQPWPSLYWEAMMIWKKNDFVLSSIWSKLSFTTICYL
jgi:hypothetical protein